MSVERYHPQIPYEQELQLRGIGDKIEIEKTETVTINPIPQNPKVTNGKTSEFTNLQQRLLEELRLGTEGQDCRVHDISFTEQRSDFGAQEYSKQGLKVYEFQQQKLDNQKAAPIVLFSHGGAIRSQADGGVIGGSGYLPTMLKYATKESVPMMLVAVDHRGSESHFQKIDYSLNDRVTDLLVTLKYTFNNIITENAKKGITWDGRIILMGDSMGGHVVSWLSGIISVDGVILTEPAAYGHQAAFAPMLNTIDSNQADVLKAQGSITDNMLVETETERDPVIITAGDQNFVQVKKETKEVSANNLGRAEKAVVGRVIGETGFNEAIRLNPPTMPEQLFSMEMIARHKNHGGKVLVISMKNDDVVSGAGTRDLNIPKEYAKVEPTTNTQIIETVGAHGSTSTEEVKAIVEFIKS